MTRVAVHVPAALRPFTEGRGRLDLDVPGETVAAALDALGSACPGLRDRILTEQGDLRPHVNVFVGAESIRFIDGLATQVPEGAEVSIIPAVSGG